MASAISLCINSSLLIGDGRSMDEMMAAAEAIAGEGIDNAKSAVTRGFWPVSARLLRELRSGAAGAVFPRTGAERFRDNRLDGPGTSAAFGTASEAPVNLLRERGKSSVAVTAARMS